RTELGAPAERETLVPRFASYPENRSLICFLRRVSPVRASLPGIEIYSIIPNFSPVFNRHPVLFVQILAPISGCGAGFLPAVSRAWGALCKTSVKCRTDGLARHGFACY